MLKRYLHLTSLKEKNILFLVAEAMCLLTKNFDGLVVKVEILGKEIIHEDDATVTLHVGAGENWHAFVMYCVDRNYGGVENLSLIPGTVGAAPMQNIGAYGVEIKKNILGVEAMEIGTGDVRYFERRSASLGIVKASSNKKLKINFLISSVTLKLTKRNHHFQYKLRRD